MVKAIENLISLLFLRVILRLAFLELIWIWLSKDIDIENKWVDECCIMLYDNMAACAKNTISWSWLLEEKKLYIYIFAAVNNEVKYGWCFTYYNCRVLRFCNQRLTVDDAVYILTLQVSPILWPLLHYTYNMVYKSACVYKLCSFAQNK